jgi:hypothetical protein
MSLDWDDLGLEGNSASVRDVWAGKDLGTINGQLKVTVPAQDGLLVLVRGRERSAAHYTPSASGSDGNGVLNGPEIVFAHLAQVPSPFAQIKVVYTNKARSTSIVGLYVNGETGTHVAFPPAASAPASVWIQAKLNRPGNTNTVTFTTSPTSDFAIESIEVYSTDNR